MTTLRAMGAEEAVSPRTHVLILGVGKYSHLSDGEAPSHANDFGLTQLTSPPASARAFANWVLNDFYNPDAPLGTVEMLLSEHAQEPYVLPSGNLVNVDPATINNIRAAFNAWFRRCDDHQGNVPIFYFCGHGLLIGGDQVLLAEDFGADPLRPADATFDCAINFSQTFLGMARCKAKLHCYFIDACSNVPVDALRIGSNNARILITPDKRWPHTNGLVLKAAVNGQSAYAISGEVSRFTEALVHCLQGLGCVNEGGRWVVRTSQMFGRLINVVKWLHAKELQQQGQTTPYETPGNERDMPDGIIHVCRQVPRVPLTIRLDPGQAIRDAAFELCATTDAHWQPHPAWQPAQARGAEAWELDPVPAGVYRLNAKFPPGTYCLDERYLFVEPPGPEPRPDPVILVRKEDA